MITKEIDTFVAKRLADENIKGIDLIKFILGYAAQAYIFLDSGTEMSILEESMWVDDMIKNTRNTTQNSGYKFKK